MVAGDAEHDPGESSGRVVVGGDRVVDERGLDVAVLGRGARRDGVAAPLAAGDDRRRLRLRPARARRAPQAAGVARGARRSAGARTKRALRPCAAAAQAELEVVGGAGEGGIGAGGRAAAVGRVVAGGVQRHPRRPAAAAPARADLRLDVRPAAPSAGPIRSKRRGARSTRVVRQPPAAACAPLVGRARARTATGRAASAGRGAQRARGDGGGAEAERLPAGEASGGSRSVEHGIAAERTVRAPANGIRAALWTNVSVRSPGRRRAARRRARRPRSRAARRRRRSAARARGPRTRRACPQRSQIAWWWCSPLGSAGS